MNRAELRANVDTIVVVMFENRSFDHLLGHLSLPQFGGRTDVDGIRNLTDPRHENPAANGHMESLFLAKDGPLVRDLPHERDLIDIQVAPSALRGGAGTMTGFVRSYEKFTGSSGVAKPPPMAILHPDSLPTTGFLAEEYLVCDRWFASLPASTQPNRLMSLCGYTLLDETHAALMPSHDTVFDWLDAHKATWRVYTAGISFWLLMRSLWPRILDDDLFRPLSQFSRDVQEEKDSTFPEVILIEPDYEDSPIHLSGHASDNHPPLPMAFGESLLLHVYDALVANPKRWAKTVLIVAYDEHGGFYDHVPPLQKLHNVSGVPDGFSRPFSTSGVRVPGLIASPFVSRRSVFSKPLDHTSVLQLIAERFGKPGEAYSPAVEARRLAGIESVSAALDAAAVRPTAYVDPPDVKIPVETELQVTRTPESANQKAFVEAVESLAASKKSAALRKYPQIAHWLRP